MAQLLDHNIDIVCRFAMKHESQPGHERRDIDMEQKAPLCNRKGEHSSVTPSTQDTALMRLSVASLRRMVNRKSSVEFVRQELTSYSGRSCSAATCDRSPCYAECTLRAGTGGDYGGRRLALLILSLFYVGDSALEDRSVIAPQSPVQARR